MQQQIGQIESLVFSPSADKAVPTAGAATDTFAQLLAAIPEQSKNAGVSASIPPQAPTPSQYPYAIQLPITTVGDAAEISTPQLHQQEQMLPLVVNNTMVVEAADLESLLNADNVERPANASINLELNAVQMNTGNVGNKLEYINAEPSQQPLGLESEDYEVASPEKYLQSIDSKTVSSQYKAAIKPVSSQTEIMDMEAYEQTDIISKAVKPGYQVSEPVANTLNPEIAEELECFDDQLQVELGPTPDDQKTIISGLFEQTDWQPEADTPVMTHNEATPSISISNNNAVAPSVAPDMVKVGQDNTPMTFIEQEVAAKKVINQSAANATLSAIRQPDIEQNQEMPSKPALVTSSDEQIGYPQSVSIEQASVEIGNTQVINVARQDIAIIGQGQQNEVINAGPLLQQEVLRPNLPSNFTADATQQVALKIGEYQQSQNIGKLVVELQPQELGKLEISIQRDHGGAEVTISAEKFATLDMLHRSSNTLWATLQDLGYTRANTTIVLDILPQSGEDKQQRGQYKQKKGESAVAVEEAPAVQASGVLSYNSDLRLDLVI